MNTFRSIPSGTPVLFDTSVLICAVTTLRPGNQNAFSAECSNLVERASNGDIRGFVPATTVTSFWKTMNAVRLMEIGFHPEKSIRRAIFKGDVPHPHFKPGKSEFGAHVTGRMDFLLRGALSIVSLEHGDFLEALTITRQAHGPITVDDALATASIVRMTTPDVFVIATARANFDGLHGVRGICVIKPKDLDPSKSYFPVAPSPDSPAFEEVPMEQARRITEQIRSGRKPPEIFKMPEKPNEQPTPSPKPTSTPPVLQALAPHINSDKLNENARKHFGKP